MSTTIRYLRRALRLAARGRYSTAPNPRVGAVVVNDDRVVGEGWHRRAGEPHAERLALDAAGEAARGATLYLNLEPCCHEGRTPPCTDAVVEAGIARVVACHGDPNPRVCGQGFRRLRQAGVQVEVGELAQEAVRLNLPFLVSRIHGRPSVTLKWAMSLDGKIATVTGESQWITSPAARAWGVDLRDEHDAILVGSGTALADDPRLTRRPPADARLPRSSEPILRVVADRRLRLRPGARMLDEPGPVLVYARRVAEPADASRSERRRRLERRGAEVVELAEATPAVILADLHGRGIQSLLVEGGGEIHAAFVQAGLYDRVVVAVAPLLLGGRQAPGPLGGEGFSNLDEAPRLEHLEARKRGPDSLLSGYRAGCLQDLLQSVAGSPKTPGIPDGAASGS